jgi:hypothetical protein
MKTIVISPEEFCVNTFTYGDTEGKKVISNKYVCIHLAKKQSTPIKAGGTNENVPIYRIVSKRKWDEYLRRNSNVSSVIELESMPVLASLYESVAKSIQDEFGSAIVVEGNECLPEKK